MKRWNASQLIWTLLACLAAAGGIGALCMCVGSTGVGWPERTGSVCRLLPMLFGSSPAGSVFDFRLESVFDSALIGAALAAAGVAYQAILRNPLSDPYLLGVSSGASLLAYVWKLPVFFAVAGGLGAAWALSQETVSFLGALMAITIVLGLAGRRGRLEPVTLVLIGVIVNAIAASLYLLISALAHQLPGYGGDLAFLIGGIQQITPGQRGSALALIAAGWVLLLYLSGQMNVAGLDDGEAQALGVRIHRLRWIALVTASLVTAAAVAISGPIGFVGLVCPHVGRLMVGGDQRRLLPVATACGAILLMAADALSRYLSAENLLANLLPVGVLTGLLGGPFFLWLLFRAKRG